MIVHGAGDLLWNRYRVVRRLGRGAAGAVYEAADLERNEAVAIKQLERGRSEDEAASAEAELLGSLDHPSAPRLVSRVRDASSDYMIMELIPGEDLRTRLTDRGGAPFPLTSVLRWASDLLDLLEYLHARTPPIVHGDIKPENLKLKADGRAVLLDFGVAAAVLRGDGRSRPGFSPAYAPIEQMLGDPPRPHCDVFSLGATIYALLAGRPPTDAIARSLALSSGGVDPFVDLCALNGEVPAVVARFVGEMAAIRCERRPSAAESATLVREILGP